MTIVKKPLRSMFPVGVEPTLIIEKFGVFPLFANQLKWGSVIKHGNHTQSTVYSAVLKPG